MRGWKITKFLSCKNCSVTFRSKGPTALHCSVECRFKTIFKSIEKDSNGCMIWPKSKNVKTGYGQFNVWNGEKRSLVTAHRMSYELFCGGIPAGMDICHKCDVRACVNPDHLFSGTAKDNVDDMFAKGRQGDYPARLRKGWIQRRLAMSSADLLK